MTTPHWSIGTPFEFIKVAAPSTVYEQGQPVRVWDDPSVPMPSAAGASWDSDGTASSSVDTEQLLAEGRRIAGPVLLAASRSWAEPCRECGPCMNGSRSECLADPGWRKAAAIRRESEADARVEDQLVEELAYYEDKSRRAELHRLGFRETR
jgi:hypothetical protein